MQSPPDLEVDSAGHLLDMSEEALSTVLRELDDKMDSQADICPKVQSKTLTFPESSEPLCLMSNKATRPIFILGLKALLKMCIVSEYIDASQWSSTCNI